MDEQNPKVDVPPSVAGRVLAAFVDAVTEDAELADVGERLRQTVLTNNDLSETALRKALFGGDKL
jgi:hypothetical protein